MSASSLSIETHLTNWPAFSIISQLIKIQVVTVTPAAMDIDLPRIILSVRSARINLIGLAFCIVNLAIIVLASDNFTLIGR